MKSKELKRLLEQFSGPVSYQECMITLRGDDGIQRAYSGQDVMSQALDYIDKLEARVAFKDADDKTKWEFMQRAYADRSQAVKEADELRARNERQAQMIKDNDKRIEEILAQVRSIG